MRSVRPRTLQGRITLLLVGVLVVATALAGVATALGLRLFLLGRLDDQITAAGGRFAASLEVGTGDDVVPGQAVGTLGVRLLDDRVDEAAVVGGDGRGVAVELTDADVRHLAGLPVDGTSHTVDLDRLHDYRLQARPGPDGAVQVTGLPEAEVDATMRRLIAVEVGLFVLVIAVAAGVVTLLVRRTLRPLRLVAETSREVAALPLTSAAVAVPALRFGPDTTSEVGNVATAFDHMLDHVRDALATRDLTEDRLRQFVADASHEFRTPLASIRAHAESLRDDPTSAQALDRIDDATRRMASLVEDLLVLARLDHAGPRAPEVTDLSRLVVEEVDGARGVAPGHRWRLDLPDDPVEVAADGEQLRRVVANLVGNAAHHTPSGTTVTVALRCTGSGARLEVADDGPGIPATLQPKVFDRFTRGDTARTSSHVGAGLGLAIVDRVVSAHDGSVTLTSAPGATCFTVALPRTPQLHEGVPTFGT
ncbi:sensor histidine kinase [Jatrophihabitans sp. YIM 134969]